MTRRAQAEPTTAAPVERRTGSAAPRGDTGAARPRAAVDDLSMAVGAEPEQLARLSHAVSRVHAAVNAASAPAEARGRARVQALIDDPGLTPERRTALAADLHRAHAGATQRDDAAQETRDSVEAVVLGEPVTLSRADLPALIAAAERLPEGPEPEPAPAPIGRGRSPREGLPVDLHAIHLSFELPANTVLDRSRDRDLLTTSATRATITVSTQGFEIRMAPPLLINPHGRLDRGVTGIVQGVVSATPLAAVYYDFTRATLRVDGPTWPLRTHVQSAFESIVRQSLAGTPLMTPGYNPVDDVHLQSTLEHIQDNFARLPRTSDSSVGGEAVQRPSLAATFAVRTPIAEGGDNARVRVPGGTMLEAHVQMGGNAAELQRATAQGRANRVERVTLRSAGITLEVGGAPAARIEEIEVSGGQVRVTRVTMLGSARGVGVLVAFFGAALRGYPPELARAVAERDGVDTIAGVTRATLSALLTAAGRQLIGRARDAVPGVDLGEALQLGDECRAPER